MAFFIERYYKIKTKEASDLPVYNLSQTVPRYKAPKDTRGISSKCYYFVALQIKTLVILISLFRMYLEISILQGKERKSHFTSRNSNLIFFHIDALSGFLINPQLYS